MLATLFRTLAGKIPNGLMAYLWSKWAPYRGAGIKVKFISKDFRHVQVEMKLRWFNRNAVGTHFGGSLYAMTDPFYMMMLIQNLGRDFIIWDKAAAIDFKKPGRGTVRAEFKLSEAQIDEIRSKAKTQGKYIFDLPVSVLDEQNEVVAEVTKTLYVRDKASQPKKP